MELVRLGLLLAVGDQGGLLALCQSRDLVEQLRTKRCMIA